MKLPSVFLLHATLAFLSANAAMRSAVADSPSGGDWASVSEDDDRIKIVTGKLEAVIPKKNPKHWMTGIEKGSFLDRVVDVGGQAGAIQKGAFQIQGRGQVERGWGLGAAVEQFIWCNALPYYLSERRASTYYSLLAGDRARFYENQLFHCPAAKFPAGIGSDN